MVLDDKIITLVNESISLTKQKYKILNNHVNYLVGTKSKDKVLIEFVLDQVLDTCVLNEGKELFDKLNNYYSGISLEGALEYKKIYSELYEMDEFTKTKVKSRR